MGQMTILDLQNKIAELDQVNCPVEHHFSDGVYCRTMYIPAGSLVVGKRHKERTLNILLQGKLSVYKGDEEPPETIEAPQVFVTQPNTKKVGYAHTSVLFANIHATDTEDLEVIEKNVIVPDEEYEGQLESFNTLTKYLEEK